LTRYRSSKFLADPLPWSLRADPFEDILPRRILAYVIDLIIVGFLGFIVSMPLSILTLLSFGLLGFLWHLVPLIGLAYSILMIAGPGSATFGMRLASIAVRRIDGGAPGLGHAILFTAGFYLSIAFTGGLILLLPLITPRHRALHDIVSGTLLVRSGQAPIY